MLRRRRMLAMRVGVVADGMFLECGDDVGAMAALERAGLLADDLECRLNALLGEERRQPFGRVIALRQDVVFRVEPKDDIDLAGRSEEHTSELQSRLHLVCRLLLEKKTYTNPDHALRPR